MKRIKQILKEQKKTCTSFFLIMVVLPFLFVSMWSSGINEAAFVVYDGDGSALSENIVQMIDSTSAVKVTYYADSAQEVADAVKYQKAAGGIIIPENFNIDIKNKMCPDVILLANGTNLILGGTAIGAAAKAVGTLNAGVQLMTLQGGGLMPQAATAAIGTFSYVERLLYEPTGGMVPKMLYSIPLMMILSIFMQKFFMPMMLEKRKEMIRCEKSEVKGVVLECVGSVALVGAWMVFASFVSMKVMHHKGGLPLRGDTVLYFVSMAAFMLNVIAFAMMCFAIVRKEKYYPLYVQMFCTLTATHMMMSGITYPFYMMPDWVKWISRIFYPVTPMAYELKALNLKGIGWEQAIPYLLDSLRYTLMWGSISMMILWIDLKKNREKYHTAANACEEEKNQAV